MQHGGRNICIDILLCVNAQDSQDVAILDFWFNESTYIKSLAVSNPEMVLSSDFHSIAEASFGMPYRTVQNLKYWVFLVLGA